MKHKGGKKGKKGSMHAHIPHVPTIHGPDPMADPMYHHTNKMLGAPHGNAPPCTNQGGDEGPCDEGMGDNYADED